LQISKVALNSSQKPATTRIAIIGGGFSGTMMAIRLLGKRFQRPIELVLIERREKVGNGIAYSTVNDLHLLNVQADGMSAFGEDPDHFLRYMHKRDPEVSWQTFCRRRDYATYLADTLKQALEEAEPKITYRHLRGTVIGIDKGDGQSRFTLLFDSQPNLTADIVVLAVGNFKGSDPLQKWEGKFEQSCYLDDAWAPGLIQSIGKDENVFFIGSGLTMVDKAMEIHASGHRGSMTALSRRGLLPQGHEEEHLKIEPELEAECARILPMNLCEAVHFVRTKSAGKDGWRSVVNALRHHCQKWWQQLEPSEQRSFMGHLQSYWDVHRHRMAPHVASYIHELIDSGRLHVIAGRIASVDQEGSTVKISFRPRNKASTLDQISAHKIVNCTGPGLNLRHISDPLLRGLSERGLVSEHASAGLEVTTDLCLVDSAGQKVNDLYAMGSLLRGVLFESIAVPELRVQAYQIANSVFDSLEVHAKTL
jgi:uncharacterized NAD(P)/FAD-binding protein YdhS